jgi:3-hydroxyisobutyrate dehydrogenase-like beta-hydroxyacid dehydrogenase
MSSQMIGFVGLGRMGCGMATNMQKSGLQLRVHDRSPLAMADLEKVGALATNDLHEIATDTDLIFLCLPAAKEVREVLFADGGIARSGKSNLTIVDTTTLDRADALNIATEAAAAGIDYWDCPVSGMPFRAVEGSLTVMFGGTDQAFQQIRPYLDRFGEFIVHAGPLGAGQAMKAINNIIYNVNIAALCEVLPLAVACGLKSEEVARVTTSASSRSFASEYFVPRMMARKFDSDFAMQDAYKDIVNIQRMAVETGAMLPVVNAMIASYQAAIAAGFGSEPKSAMLKIYENAIGVEFKDTTSFSGTTTAAVQD